MTLHWRLAILGIQILILLSATYWVEERLYSSAVWFSAGLVVVIVNPQLLEPYYSKPGDVIGNSLLFLVAYGLSSGGRTGLGWHIGLGFVSTAAVLALFGVLFKSRSDESSSQRLDLPRGARALSQLATARVVGSSAFFLSLLDVRPNPDTAFWTLTSAWAAVTFLGVANWERIWSSIRPGPPVCIVEGIVGPSVLTIVSPRLPAQGTWVQVAAKGRSARGLVIRRISRRDDVWGQVHLTDSHMCESLLASGSVHIHDDPHDDTSLVGSVDAGSSDVGLQFIATQPLEIGQVVAVPVAGKGSCILYQLTGAVIEHTDVKGGAHLFERARATQLGFFAPEEHRFRRHAWVPRAGAPVLTHLSEPASPGPPAPPTWELVGHVIGTPMPVYLDLEAASSGHVAILGMTKMGKSTLAERLARALSGTRSVTILDLTGEYISRKALPRYTKATDTTQPGLSVLEPKPGEVPPDRALAFLKYLLDFAQQEYRQGNPCPRTVIIDEAHQFIPEPAGMGFNVPGRESSIQIGLLLMQIRKFGLSVILISQRTAVVAKSALSQCENVLSFRSVDQTGLDYLESIAGSDVRQLLPRLRQGQALAFGPAVSSDVPVAVTVAQAETPEAQPVVQAEAQADGGDCAEAPPSEPTVQTERALEEDCEEADEPPAKELIE